MWQVKPPSNLHLMFSISQHVAEGNAQEIVRNWVQRSQASRLSGNPKSYNTQQLQKPICSAHTPRQWNMTRWWLTQYIPLCLFFSACFSKPPGACPSDTFFSFADPVSEPPPASQQGGLQSAAGQPGITRGLSSQELKPQATLRLQPGLAVRRTQLAYSLLKLFQMRFSFLLMNQNMRGGCEKEGRKRETRFRGKGSCELVGREDGWRGFRCLLT